jgi:hypothetical protein
MRNDVFLEEFDEQFTIERPMNNHPIDESIVRIYRQNTPLSVFFALAISLAGRPFGDQPYRRCIVCSFTAVSSIYINIS